MKSTLLCVFTVALLAGQARADLVLNMTELTLPSTPAPVDVGSIGSATFANVHQRSTGTGVINSFARIEGKENEAGYNTDAKPVLDTKSGSHTHALLASAVPQLTHSDFDFLPDNGKAYWEFLLDINEGGSPKSPDPLISLNDLMLFRGTEAQLRYFNGTAMVGTTNPTKYDLVGPAGATKVYDLDSGENSQVLLNYDLNPGSGGGDLFVYIPVASAGDYLLLYSQFGNPPGTYSSSAGFEEWAVQDVSTPRVPAPAAALLGMFGLTTAGWRLRRFA